MAGVIIAVIGGSSLGLLIALAFRRRTRSYELKKPKLNNKGRLVPPRPAQVRLNVPLKRLPGKALRADPMIGEIEKMLDAGMSVQQIQDKLLKTLEAEEESAREKVKDDECPECGEMFAIVDDYICPKCRKKRR